MTGDEFLVNTGFFGTHKIKYNAASALAPQERRNTERILALTSDAKSQSLPEGSELPKSVFCVEFVATITMLQKSTLGGIGVVSYEPNLTK